MDSNEDFLWQAKRNIGYAQITDIGGAGAQANAQLAIACALVALIERLDALTNFDDGKALFVTLTK